jgi:hypothetical protein
MITPFRAAIAAVAAASASIGFTGPNALHAQS